ncbi:MAG TPA: SH3 domain-containing protein [Dyella sp.]|uniref:SH3 domain-containing protein n=1 Tax=Dyella sp. TaxID=1869338 RepID=UPI002BB52BD6|nr:SH3 domain-containing protein [Dyella sp.]HUB92301.1 SH3 domain-containing protein [Dyella sp.]
MKRMLWWFVAMVLTVVPATAFAMPGYTVATVNLLAGPDPQYPLIYTLDAGTPVDVQGCTEGWQWCDVVVAGNRGWIAGPYIEYLYNNQPVIVTDYGARIGIPVVTFAIGAYWGRYYVNRPFYCDRARWYGRPVPIRPYPGPRPPVRPMPRPPYGGNRPGPGNRPPAKPGSGGHGGNYPPPGSGGNGGNYPPPAGGNRPGRPPSGGEQGGNAGARPGSGQQGGSNGRGPQGNRPTPQRNPPPQRDKGNDNGG